MIDMHNHILFGVDDGAKTLYESIELIKEEIQKGVTHIIVTPHFNKRNYYLFQDKISVNFQLLKEAIEKEDLNVQLYLGNEVYLEPTNYISTLDNGFYTLADSKYILVEFNEIIPPDNIPEMCYEISICGYIPIIAHIERYEILYDNKKLLVEILGEGALLQVNASSIINKENNERNKFAHYLLKNELVSFAASDVHNNTTRKFYLDEAYKVVCQTNGKSYADKIFSLNQLGIINNKEIVAPKFKLKRKWL